MFLLIVACINNECFAAIVGLSAGIEGWTCEDKQFGWLVT